ncbi:D-2-hydroxyacid dehydrogenase [Mangrovibacillus cuniculi]|uniref:D-2-hydroxyacid dehydrogenase n=1 Tax=Mangrovibacillus cuniculi TaxID=2593652 RepID=A0A7S8HEF9_9BACI|nr:D-2-hydroxyacid dehydrogenase [Mangrovibacillus cuniculi]QPC45799.1 D-2-hydroxyacid dehydrogenase [Mangrovibacillus cuniculi]
MNILFTFEPNQDFQQHFQSTYQDLHWTFAKSIREAEKRLSDAEVIVTYGEDLRDQHIEQATNLKWIMVVSAGLEKMPFASIQKKNILVTNARGIHAIPMAEYTLGVMIHHAKQMKLLAQQEEEHLWNRRVPMQELYGQTAMIVGAGAIGTRIAHILKAFTMNVIGVNTSGTLPTPFDEAYSMEDMDQALPNADYIISILPSTPSTIDFWRKPHFKLMKSTAVFINIGRGDAVDDKVLLDTMNNNEIAHAYLDVFKHEPLPSEHAFWKQENITVTPHISSITKKYLPRSFEIFEQNLKLFIEGQEDFQNIIDVKRGY